MQPVGTQYSEGEYAIFTFSYSPVSVVLNEGERSSIELAYWKEHLSITKDTVFIGLCTPGACELPHPCPPDSPLQAQDVKSMCGRYAMPVSRSSFAKFIVFIRGAYRQQLHHIHDPAHQNVGEWSDEERFIPWCNVVPRTYAPGSITIAMKA